jgi:probable rRNA maturation factor
MCSANPKPRGARLALAIQMASRSDEIPARAQLRKWARAALDGPASITLRIVDEAEAQALNRDYRGKNYPTNVLTFAYPGAGQLRADIVLCAPVITREAEQQGKPVAAHFAHLVVHGTLHARGYDHASGKQARVMESIESAIVKNLGYADPYAKAGVGRRKASAR